MSQMIDFTLPSCVPGRTLHAFRCVPEGEVRAILRTEKSRRERQKSPENRNCSGHRGEN
jgi:hypothetical protein